MPSFLFGMPEPKTVIPQRPLKEDSRASSKAAALWYSSRKSMHCVIVLGKVHAMNDRPRQKTQKKEDDDLAIGARDELRLRVLRALEANPKLSQRQLAVELGVSLGGVNYALRALIGRGFVKAGNFVRSDKKAAYLYTLTPSGLAEKSSLAAAFLSRKLEEYDVLTREIEDLKQELDSNLGTGAR